MIDPASIGMGVLEAFRTGQAEGEQRRYRSALSTYVTDPSQSNLAALAPYNPEMVLKERERLAKSEAEAAQVTNRQQAAAGDPAARARLAGYDFDAWSKLNDDQRKQQALQSTTIGNAAFDVARRPPEQQAAAWDSYIDQLSQQYPELAQFKGKYTPELLQATIAQANMSQDWIKSQMPDYQVIPQGGTLIDTRNAQATQQFSPQQGSGNLPQISSPDQARSLPPGSQFLLPDGRIGTVPGGPASAPGGFQR